jgi:ribonuclease HI
VKRVTIHTDGSCLGNPGPGGWAAILHYGKHERELVGADAMTTNNRMEMFAAVAALDALKEPCEVELYSDSSYLVNAFQKGWVERWQRNGWRTAGGDPVKNSDLWEKLVALNDKHTISFRYVPGHAGHELNERCDKLARDAAGRLKDAARA